MTTDTTTTDPADRTAATGLPSGTVRDPAVRVAKIGYVGFQTPDVERLLAYYTDVLGFASVSHSTSQAFLTTGTDHHCVVVDKAERSVGRTFVGYQIHGSLDDAQRRLAARGLVGERRTDIAPGTPDVLVLSEPGTGVPLHLFEEQASSGVAQTWDQRPNKLGHAAAFVPSIEVMQAFYQEALGFRWSDTIGDFFVFLRCNVDHHSANFMANPKARGLHHIAYEARDLNHLQTMIDNLQQHGFPLNWGPGRHGAGHNIFTYHHDPDGNQIELFTQLDVIYDEDKGYFEPRPWHEDHPQYPKSWEVDMAMNVWGPKPPGGMGGH